jgi:hypothetical protein
MSKGNDLTKTYSGMFGNRVVLNEGKRKSKITMPPTRQKPVPTANQVEHYKKMRLSVLYARDAMLDPVLKSMYAAKSRKGLPPYRVAVNDFMKLPVIEQIDATGYQGNPGEIIRVSASDDFKVASVEVEISDSGGKILEKGPCVFTMPYGSYNYRAKTLVSNLPGLVIQATVMDIPGHEGVKSLTL